MVCSFHLQHINLFLMMTIADASNLVAYLLHISSIINRLLLTSAKIVLRIYQFPFLRQGKELCHFRNVLIMAWKSTTLNLSLWDQNLIRCFGFAFHHAKNLWITVTITCIRIYWTSGQKEFSIEIMILFYHWKKNCLTNFNQMLESYLNNPLNLHQISKR